MKGNLSERIVILSLALTILCIITLASDARSWHITTVDYSPSQQLGKYNSLAFDLAGNPAISYYGAEGLTYASLNGSNWSINHVDSGYAKDTSLAFDSSGNPHISRGRGGEGLTHASFDGVNWSTERVDDRGSDTSLAFDHNGNPCIAYYHYLSGDIKCATFDGLQWNIEALDFVGAGLFSSITLAFDPVTGNPAISYSDHPNRLLKYATFDNGWSIQTVDNITIYNSLAFDPITGNPAIAYQSMDLNLKYASFNGIGWDIETVDTRAGQRVSLDFDPNGNPGITYVNKGLEELRYASLHESDWSIDIVYSSDTVTYNSLAFDPVTGKPGMSFCDEANNALKYATVPIPSSLLTLVTITGLAGLSGFGGKGLLKG